MPDMSTLDTTSADIFRLILDNGPLTLYDANKKSNLAIGTIHRHFKYLQDTGKIKVYHNTAKGRKKISYGPTVFGFVYFNDSEQIKNNLENYFLLWSDKKEFLDELEQNGFEKKIIQENLQEYKNLFCKYVEFFSAMERQIIQIGKGELTLPREILMFISTSLLTSDPKYQKIWEELYINMAAIRKSTDDYFKSTNTSYREFKKKLKPKIKN